MIELDASLRWYDEETMTTMRALEIRDGKLQLAELPLPVTTPGEVLVKVAYAGINRADVMQIAGQYAPPEGASPLPGLEVSGTVDGTPVCALLSGGGYAEYVAVPAAQVLPLPTGIDLKSAASLPEACATSVMALMDEGHLNAGQHVLIHGGTSGVGLMMTQVAKALGAQVVTTVGSAKKAAFMEQLGIRAIDHTSAPFEKQIEPQRLDLIIDTLGGPAFEAHLRLLKKGGRLVSLAMLQGSEVPNFKLTRILMNHLTITGATLRSRSAGEKAAILAQVKAKLWPKLADGSIKPHIDSVFALPEAQKALKRMEERLHMGKILLEVSPQ